MALGGNSARRLPCARIGAAWTTLPSRRGRAAAARARCIALILVGAGTFAVAQPSDDDCMLCHNDSTLTKQLPDGQTISLFVDPNTYASGVHAGLGCVACHDDITEVPHAEDLKDVNCAACHEQEAEVYAKSLHGIAVQNQDPLAPKCSDCHTAHDIRSPDDPKSLSNPINIPTMCAQCHAEDATVAKSRNIAQHDILKNYEDSMHAAGLLQQGLKVTAVCTSCHTAHNVLPHTDPASTIHRDNVVGTCTQCHALIEEVHRKVIDGELWEKDPQKIPICIDCHQAHQARTIYYDEGVSDRDCMTCHANEVTGATRTLPPVDDAKIHASAHNTVRCAQCHTGATPSLPRPCETVAPEVDCSICHADQVQQHDRSIHGQLLANNDPDAPACLDCHDSHGTQRKTDPTSPTFSKNVPTLCGRCHREGEAAATRLPAEFAGIVNSYTESVHGKGLLESGLVVAATCTNCHTAHEPLPPDDPASSVSTANIAGTCGQCHHGVEETFLASIHSPLVSNSTEKLPVCSSCHTAHSIQRTSEEHFKQDILTTCGECHAEVTDTYFDTYHGKVSKLGSDVAARCHDCHGAHDMLPVSNPKSHLSHDNIVETCAKCHEGANRRFAGYLTHATHHDPDKYPALFFAFWGMTALLVGTFGFFGIHTLMWFPRSLKEMRARRAAATHGPRRMVKRFDPVVRQMHFVLILSFFGLALTGMTLKFSYMGWAQWLSKMLGGFYGMGLIHRVCAVAMFAVFLVHIGYIVHRKRQTGSTWKEMLLGSGTLLPTWRDAREFIETIRYFRGKGPRPKYGEWTYWEKFDYFAVFWGVAIIGSTGLMLWFPEFFTLLLPGWVINVATIIHSDEALLAVGFIFTIHFFNTNFRPEKFPMDLAMFTGLVPEEELKEERPRYYEELKASGELEKRYAPDVPKEFRFWAVLFGAVALTTGFALVIFIVWSMVFGYR